MRSSIYLLSLFVGLATCQTAEITIFDVLNNTESSPIQWISQWLQTPEGQSLAELLSQKENNLTLFIPSDQVYQGIQSMNTTNEQPTGDETTGDETTDGTTEEKVQDPTAYFTSPYINEFNLTDVLYYHIVNQSIDLQEWFNTTTEDTGNEANPDGTTSDSESETAVYNGTVVNSLISNSTLDTFGSGVPLLLQKIQVNSTNTEESTDGGTTDEDGSTDGESTDGSSDEDGSTDYTDYNPMNGEGSSAIVDMNNTTFNYTVGNSVGYANINTTSAVQASNGFIYIIDKVLVPPVGLNETIESVVNATNITSPFNLTESYNVTQFEQLLTNLNTTNVTAFDSFTNTSNVTYFMPIDEAFQTLTDLDEKSIANILSAHIVQGVYYTSNVTENSTDVQSLAGTDITFAANGTGFIVNNVNVVQPNILVNTGVIHLIDGVLNYTEAATDDTNTNSAVASESPSASVTSNDESMTASSGSSSSAATSGEAGNTGDFPSGTASNSGNQITPATTFSIFAFAIIALVV